MTDPAPFNMLHDPAPNHLPDSSLLAGYAPAPDSYDECLAANGTVRPHWQGLLSSRDAMAPAEREARAAASIRYLRDAGVAHRVYGDRTSTERPWPLSPLPLMISAAEWRELSEGLVERAELLEALIADCYGPQHLVRDGVVPASLVAGSPGFLRPLVGVAPPGGHHLHFLAIELGRGPDGRWWVLGDRVQAPSGAGYALENRMAMIRGAGSDIADHGIARLAAFFQMFREAAGNLRGTGSARVALLTPGPFNETYYEQAFLARYLGFLLVEGADLTVHENALHVRTVRGLKRIDALWRRVDAHFCDPLELWPHSQLGVPGLVEAVRKGTLACFNSLGASLIESRGLMACMPQLATRLLGSPLKLPTIATWWLGDEASMAAWQASDAPTILAPAHGTTLPLSGEAQAAVLTNPATRHAHVAQEVVRLSTMPACDVGSDNAFAVLEPRACSLRVFLARTSEGWTVMPGGFCRVSAGGDTRALSMQTGSLSADVWVEADADTRGVLTLAPTAHQPIRRVPGTLPARAADNLYWLGRYSERAQMNARFIRALVSRSSHAAAPGEELTWLLDQERERWGGVDDNQRNLFDAGVRPELERAHSAASAIRDRFSPEAWQCINAFMEALHRNDGSPGRRAASPSLMDQLDDALIMLAAFAGLVGDNMMRLSGWRFLELGRRIERGIATARYAGILAFDPAQGANDTLLEIADCLMSYRRRYALASDRATVLDLVVLDPNNPRSLAFQLDRIRAAIDDLTQQTPFDPPTDLQSAAFALWSDVHRCHGETLERVRLEAFENALMALSEQLSGQFIPATEGQVIEDGWLWPS